MKPAGGIPDAPAGPSDIPPVREMSLGCGDAGAGAPFGERHSGLIAELALQRRHADSFQSGKRRFEFTVPSDLGIGCCIPDYRSVEGRNAAERSARDSRFRNYTSERSEETRIEWAPPPAPRPAGDPVTGSGNQAPQSP